jgi:hypothetical protein
MLSLFLVVILGLMINIPTECDDFGYRFLNHYDLKRGSQQTRFSWGVGGPWPPNLS